MPSPTALLTRLRLTRLRLTRLRLTRLHLTHLRLAPLFAVALAACTPAEVPPSPPPAPASPPSREVSAVASASPTPVDRPSGYDKPPKAILDIMDASNPPSIHVSPTGEKSLLVWWVDYPPMARVAEPFLRLAGVRIEPRNHSRHDTSGGNGIRPCTRAYTLVTMATGAQRPIALPRDACPLAPIWSTDGAHFAFQSAAADAVDLWIGDGATGELRKVPGVRLNPIFGGTLRWMPGQRSLLVKTVPEGLGPPPPPPVVPIGPSVQEANGEKGESSTYETRDTLKNKHDEELFEYYASIQLAVVDAETLAVKRVGSPALYEDIDVAPDGAHVLVSVIKKPFSYVTTHDHFAHDVGVLDATRGDVHPIASLPLADRVPVHGVPKGPRDFAWRATQPATLIWAEALDGGDWNINVPARDKVLMQKAPFTDAPVEIARTPQRFTGLVWTETDALAFLEEYDHNRHWRRVSILNVDDPNAKRPVLWDLSSEEKYKNPGEFILRELPNGHAVARKDGDSIYLTGEGASPSGDRPFVDRLDLKTRKTERLFRSDKSGYEFFLAFASDKPGATTIFTRHETPTEPPNVFVRTLGAPVAAPPDGEPTFASTRAAVTHMPDPAPAIRTIKKRLVKYKRKDGTDLSFTIYTPPDYREGTRVPTILYAYPLDYADSKKAGQVTGSEMRFTRLRDYRLLLLAGYAIIDDAAFPIVGDPKKAYDTYLEQLVANAKAAVEKGIEIGIVDGARVGVTGHSHGALMTVNLLAHSDLFRAGVATSGSYNKTLTPFGFQNERRSVWAAQSVYLKASPFFFADKLKLPLLLMHGEEDANPGTTPLQATKLFEAIRGNGGTTRLVMLPHEPHWYTARESNEQELAEMVRWFDKYVKNAPSSAK